jgi:preprotein translocase subunit SecF
MEFFRIRSDLPFMKHALVFNIISFVTFLLAVAFLVFRGLHFSIEFTGGTVVEVHYGHAADIDAVRGAVAKIGYSDAVVQSFGSSQDVLIRLPLRGEMAGEQSKQIADALKAADASAEVRKVEFVGPQVGKELAVDGAVALTIVILGIIVYLAIRFEWRLAVATVIANLHDVVIILGFFALFQWEFSLPVLAAVLAILGYSVNESVVVFDRVRENFRKMRRASVAEIMDNAITRTMSRTVITHGCTQLAVISMLFFGGEALHNFALALTIGICFGIYSSVLVAAPIAMYLGVSREDFVKPKREENQEAVV